MIKVICFAHFILRVKDNNSHYLKFVICHPVTLEAVTYVIQIQSSICSRNYIICLSLECVSIELRLVDGRLGKPSQLSMRKKIVSLCCLFTGTPLHTMEHALLKVIQQKLERTSCQEYSRGSSYRMSGWPQTTLRYLLVGRFFDSMTRQYTPANRRSISF